WLTDDGLFLDVTGKYLRNAWTFRLPDVMPGSAKFPRSSTLLGSVQAGYHAGFGTGRFFAEPSVEVIAGRTSGYSLQSDEVRIRVDGGRPVYAKLGLAAGVNWQADEQHAVSFSAGLYRLQDLHRNSTIRLSDRLNTDRDWTLRHVTQAARDNRWLINAGVNARLSPDWRIYTELESSTGGLLHHDYSGQVGIRYQF
ncbi:autotransporter outer membrane beta-barrel domain-containing protein, partial [Salmonella enterica]